MIEKSLRRYTDLFERMDTVITPEAAFRVFQQLADTYAPTLTARYTRGLRIQRILEDMKGVGSLRDKLLLDLNFRKTGNVAITLGTQEVKPIWAFAHLDNISYLTGPKVDGLYALTPFHEPRISDGERDGVALGYDDSSQRLRIIAEGTIITSQAGAHSEFRTEEDDLPPATRVVFQTEASWDRNTGMLYGSVDDAFGCAALVMCAIVLSSLDVDALIVLTDEEEGVVGVGNTAFARGSQRMISRTDANELPAIMSVTDLHEVSPSVDDNGEIIEVPGCGEGALFAGFASGTRGGVTPPHVLAAMREVSGWINGKGILLRENQSYVSRSDCVSAMMATQNVILMGFPGAYSHFENIPRAHINDLVALSKSLTVLIAAAQSSDWRKHYLID
jgi:hypothetical protein